jgi:hypothetical protein
VIVGYGCCDGWISVSTNGGATFSQSVYGAWNGVRSSANGSKLIALQGSSPILVSADFGAAWSVFDAQSENWVGVILSADGNRFVAAANGSGIYTWQPTTPLIASPELLT